MNKESLILSVTAAVQRIVIANVEPSPNWHKKYVRHDNVRHDKSLTGL